jgi:hypothetical protein
MGVVTSLVSLVSSTAAAQELDTLLPDNLPGYGTPFGVVDRHPAALRETGVTFGGLNLAPGITAAGGYDSAPNGAAGSALFSIAPSLLASDPLLGFGALASVNFQDDPQNISQNTSGYTLAAGELMLLPSQKIILGAGYVAAQETGFALDTVAITRPVAFNVLDFRGSDEISLATVSFKPELETTRFNFASFSSQNRDDDHETFTTSYTPDGPIRYLLRLHATQSVYAAIPAQNSDSDEALAGLVDTADGLWRCSALAGAARRVPRHGRGVTAPVLEAGLDWMPGDLDRLRFTFAHEIDDPDEISLTPYTLTAAGLSLTHEYATDIILNFSAKASNAAYLHSRDREDVFALSAGADWQLNAATALTATYDFNDRQANYLPAANEHVLTLGLTWTP